ncbi:hypothetical protein M0R45_005027 [Rubus argutus]|uniref:Uncharacterized protein n=1 Tax=Rubus argutus TaxID=59490 RepID=A0AAW1YLN4_RUBAR
MGMAEHVEGEKEGLPWLIDGKATGWVRGEKGLIVVLGLHQQRGLTTRRAWVLRSRRRLRGEQAATSGLGRTGRGCGAVAAVWALQGHVAAASREQRRRCLRGLGMTRLGGQGHGLAAAAELLGMAWAHGDDGGENDRRGLGVRSGRGARCGHGTGGATAQVRPWFVEVSGDEVTVVRVLAGGKGIDDNVVMRIRRSRSMQEDAAAEEDRGELEHGHDWALDYDGY